MEYIKIAASASFIIFGLWTIRGDTLHGEDKRFNFSPFWTVAIAFFIAEMGDKTQLATIALAVKYNTVFTVWMGTTLGMLVADAIGIIVGIVMGKNIPEKFIKWFAALIFIAFGIYGLCEVLPKDVWNPAVVAGGMILLLISIYFLSRMNRQGNSRSSACERK